MHDLLDKDDKEVSLTFGKGLSVVMAFEGRTRELTISEIAAKVNLKPRRHGEGWSARWNSVLGIFVQPRAGPLSADAAGCCASRAGS